MKRARPLLVIGLLWCASCSPSADSASSGADSTGAMSRAEREGQVEARLDVVRARLDSLRSDAVTLGPALTSAMDARIAALEAEKDSAKVRLAQLRAASEEAWDDTRAGIAVMLDSLDTKIDRARRDLHRSG